MRTREEELLAQVMDILKEFHSDFDNSSLLLNENDLESMISIETTEEDKGSFFSNELEQEIFFKFLKINSKTFLLFIKLDEE